MSTKFAHAGPPSFETLATAHPLGVASTSHLLDSFVVQHDDNFILCLSAQARASFVSQHVKSRISTFLASWMTNEPNRKGHSSFPWDCAWERPRAITELVPLCALRAIADSGSLADGASLSLLASGLLRPHFPSANLPGWVPCRAFVPAHGSRVIVAGSHVSLFLPFWLKSGFIKFHLGRCSPGFSTVYTYIHICVHIYIYMLPPRDLPFVAFIAWKPPELLK